MSTENKNGLSWEDEMLFGDIANTLEEKEDSSGDDTEDKKPGSDTPDKDDDKPIIPSDSDEDTDDDSTDSDEDDDSDEDGQEPDDGDDNDDSNDSDDDGADDTSSPLTPYAKMLVEEDILPGLNLEEFDGTAEGLKSAMTEEIHSGIENYKSKLPEPVKALINDYEDGVPFDEILKIKSEQISVSNIKEESVREDEDLQKKIITNLYKKTTRFSDEKIKKTIDRLDNIGDLEDEAVSALSELKEITADEERVAVAKAKKDREEQEKAYKETLTKTIEYIENAKEFVPGQKVSKAIREKIKQNMTIPVGYDQNGNPVSKLANHLSKDPIQSEIMLNYLFEITNGFSDFSAFGRGQKSKVMKELENASKEIDEKSRSKGGTKRKKSTGDFMSAIRDMM